ncbi:hypothetical protein [Actinophytocola oryzae]|uniref:Excalibur calcium-binding domain-containing protein n=1 Tax=Actinophytocola oryzae TaxID=502181 RepID=A0A4R7VF03_9PSEU|nr:hypothetical protein [Actinophytocola oryzae]TDV47774.1 hypothetical protein CLV71_1099 [Actinophytocola oryzae]
MVENSTSGLAMVAAEVVVTVTREEQHQDALAGYAPAPGGRRRVAVELAWCVVGAGKYRGEHAIEVRLDGRRVGELTYPMSQRYAPLVTWARGQGGRAGCEAVVEGGERGLQLTLRLPRDLDNLPAVATAATEPATAVHAVPNPQGTFARHRRAWVVAGAVTAVLFFVAIANGDEDADVSPSAADETTTTAAVPTTTETTTTTTTPPPTTTTTTTTTVVPPPPPAPPQTQEPVAPPPAVEPPPVSQCDPNYSGCVPIASDVDCAGGSGNGPAYADGPVTVIGNDIYDLDRDGNGVACE